MNLSAMNLQPLRTNELESAETRNHLDWLWEGYLARGNITLLTSLWKAGKTTLVAGLLRQLEAGEPFLGRPCRPATALVLSEEPRSIWAERLKSIPIGPHVQLLLRPFPRRPEPAEWSDLLAAVTEPGPDVRPDLVVVDTLAAFLPGRSESDPATLLDFLLPLRSLAESGTSVMIQHHPRKQESDLGSAARGGGALLGYVDIILELNRHGRLRTDETRRSLFGLSRSQDTPRQLVYEWTPGTPDFRVVTDPEVSRFATNWPIVAAILKDRKSEASARELLADWPDDLPPPGASLLYGWLQRATLEEKVIRIGNGTKNDPYRYRLPNEYDEYVKSLPPLPELPPLPPLGRW